MMQGSRPLHSQAWVSVSLLSLLPFLIPLHLPLRQVGFLAASSNCSNRTSRKNWLVLGGSFGFWALRNSLATHQDLPSGEGVSGNYPTCSDCLGLRWRQLGQHPPKPLLLCYCEKAQISTIQEEKFILVFVFFFLLRKKRR